MSKRLLPVFLACFTISTVYAQSSVSSNNTYNWSGIYAGMNLGYGFAGKNEYSFGDDGGNQGNYSPEDGGGSFSQNFNNFFLGAQVGENWQFNRIVWGIETSLEWLKFSKTSTNVFPAASVTPGSDYKTELNWLYTLTPRVGYATNNFLTYIKSGLALTEAKSKLSNSTYDTYQEAPSSFSQSQYMLGVDVGAGVNYGLGNWIIGIEYNYFYFGSRQFGGDDYPDEPGTSGNYPLQYSLKTSFSTITGMVSYKF